MSKVFRDWNVEQEYLFPPSVKEFVPEGHLSHFIRDIVQQELNLSDILACYQEERGYPPYHPVMMTAVLLYSYTQGIYSSRKISQSCEQRVDFMAISGMNKPDFRTISNFRKRHLTTLGSLFVQVLKLCQSAQMTKLGHVALDGSKVKANASKENSKSYRKLREDEQRLKQEVQSWFEQAGAVDTEEDNLHGTEQRGDELPSWVVDKKERIAKLKEARERLEQEHTEKTESREKAEQSGQKPKSKTKKTDKPKDTKSHNFTDPDSQLMRSRQGFVQAYNAQIAVDHESYVIVASDVSTDKNDLEQLIPLVKQIKDNLDKLPQELSADTGYCSEQNLESLAQNKIKGYVALGRDPAERKKKISPGTHVHQMSQRIKKAGKRTRYRIRKYTVEPVFGVIKSARNFQHFYLRGIQNVKNEWLLVCAAYNIVKLANARA